eukprot:921346-Amorphochlora_amoeboformis.AAC.1
MLAALPQPPAYASAALSSVSPSQPLPLSRLQPFFGSREVSGAMRLYTPKYPPAAAGNHGSAVAVGLCGD